MTDNLLTEFAPISLSSYSSVGLIKRVDTKYIFNKKYLSSLIQLISQDYSVLTIDGCKNQPYESVYYDTASYNLYKDHYRDKRSRFKVRRRSYSKTGIKFIETKEKNNRGVTSKTRHAIVDFKAPLTANEISFLRNINIPHVSDLIPVININYDRISLTSTNLSERITIDSNLRVFDDSKTYLFDEFVIVEIKQGRYDHNSPVIQSLKN
jgi:hypothetical protein